MPGSHDDSVRKYKEVYASNATNLSKGFVANLAAIRTCENEDIRWRVLNHDQVPDHLRSKGTFPLTTSDWCAIDVVYVSVEDLVRLLEDSNKTPRRRRHLANRRQRRNTTGKQ
jgi:hypothetical protein